MALAFTPASAIPGAGTITVALSSTAPTAGIEVFALTTPKDAAAVTVTGCGAATAAISSQAAPSPYQEVEG